MGSKSDFKGCINHGPWGGSGGNKWVYMPQGLTEKENIKITLGHGRVVDYIKFETDCAKGGVHTYRFGSTSYSKEEVFSICYADEYLMSISGTVGSHDGSDVVTSICFMTNLKLVGPWGTNTGTVFSYDVNDGEVVGFHGRASNYLNAIGVYVKPKSLASAPNHMPKLCSSMSGMITSRDAGPWGTGGGKPWDDGVFSTLKQVHVHLGELNVIYALQFEYLKSDGNSVRSQIHGGTDGSKIELVHLDVKDEFLTGISGFYGPVEGYNGMEAIVSISLHTNKRVYGPYGQERGAAYVYFCSTPSSGKVVGFHGRHNGFLSAIGVHKEYV